MSLDRKILEELKRFNEITKYVLLEQEPPAEGDVPPPPPAEGETPPPPPAEGAAPPADAGAPPAAEGAADAIPEPVDVESDPDVEEVGTEEKGEEETEEIDITDLITAQQEIKDKQDSFMEDMFKRLDDLQSKLENMDQIMTKINSLETKFDRYREKTPEEKLELRSLDSYPYNQKLTDFFDDKKEEMEKTGKNEYVLTQDEVENFSPSEIENSFNEPMEDEDDILLNKFNS